ncbi:MAG: putative thiamine-monophosphate kinase [Planctomycetota bacterium]|jgi:thiamine-monophosphate kinase
MREFELVRRICAENGRLPASVLIPPGDDMAMLALPTSAASRLLAAADSVVEGVHVPAGCDPFVFGRKAVLRNLSDVAAMGGARPLATLACLFVPPGLDGDRIARILDGVRETAEAWHAPLVGGDTTAVAHGAPLALAVTILATPVDATARIATRRDARAGDGVYATGALGRAWDRATGLGRHLDFTPRIAVGQALARTLGDRLGAMIDLSDGLGRDLGHVAGGSGVSIEIDANALPLAEGATAEDALRDGEDYELAFTARGAVPREIEGVRVTRIGTVVAGRAAVLVRGALEGVPAVEARSMGFEHEL